MFSTNLLHAVAEAKLLIKTDEGLIARAEKAKKTLAIPTFTSDEITAVVHKTVPMSWLRYDASKNRFHVCFHSFALFNDYFKSHTT